MFLILAFFFILSSCDYTESIFKLLDLMDGEYVEKTTNFSVFPIPSWSEKEGLYRSYIHFNIIGEGEIETNLRRTFRIPDSNMFVTNFISIIKLELYELYKEKYSLNTTQFARSLSAFDWFQDKMYKEGTAIYRFWPMYEQDNLWVSYPANLAEPLSYFPDAVSFVEFVCKILRLDKCEGVVEEIAHEMGHMIDAFKIPADIDDSFCNLGLGGLLTKLKDDFPDSYKQFYDYNQQFSPLFDLVEQYSWKPFKANPSSSYTDDERIDPRTYMFSHEFFSEVKTFIDHKNEIKNKEEVSICQYFNIISEVKETSQIHLPGTWILDTTLCEKYFGYEAIPFNINNVDVNVITNFLFGLTYFFLYNDPQETQKYLTPELIDLYTSTASYIVWCTVNSRVRERPDIGLTYYPSLYDFYWFFTRITFLLNNYPKEKEFPFPEMESIASVFLNVSQNEITKEIFDLVNSTYVGYCYWDDFLGDYGGIERGEDRLFSTGLAVSALLDAWTKETEDGTSKRIWRDGVTKQIKDTIFEGLEFINDHIFKGDALVENAFFSGSTRGVLTLPFFYPANYYKYLNGSSLPSTTWPPQDQSLLTDDLVAAVEGIVNDDEYNQWKKLKFFGMVPPDYNTGFDTTFPYWSSPALTYAISMIAMAKYESIQG